MDVFQNLFTQLLGTAKTTQLLTAENIDVEKIQNYWSYKFHNYELMVDNFY